MSYLQVWPRIWQGYRETNPGSDQSGTLTRNRWIASPTRRPLGHAASLITNDLWIHLGSTILPTTLPLLPVYTITTMMVSIFCQTLWNDIRTFQGKESGGTTPGYTRVLCDLSGLLLRFHWIFGGRPFQENIIASLTSVKWPAAGCWGRRY